MNIEKLARRALSIIKSKWELPDSGLLAGGSLANIIWELVSGNKAIVNDIDIFILKEIIDYNDDLNPIFEYREEETNYLEEYSGMAWTTKTNKYYRITEANNYGMINTIDYISNTSEPSIVIDSFDINCTKIGYDIKEDKFYWTDDFVEFLKSGNLKVSNLKTPAHTAIRISKKSKELNAKLDELELKLIQHVLLYGFSDVLRKRFKVRYYNIYNDNIDILGGYFKIQEDIETQKYISNKYNDDSQIWFLSSIVKNNVKTKKTFEDLFLEYELVFKDRNILQINRTDEFLFYMRNIFGNDRLMYVWSKVKWFFKDIDYVDSEISDDDLILLNKLSIHAPNSIEKLKGYSLSEQLSIVKKLLNRFKDDPIIAISILEKNRIDKDIELDDETSLLLELSVRKQIVNDTKGKASKILDNKEDENF